MKAYFSSSLKKYEFDAQPYGVHPYHCHIAPVTRHIGKGLYGLLIIDPQKGRPPADEMVFRDSCSTFNLNGSILPSRVSDRFL